MKGEEGREGREGKGILVLDMLQCGLALLTQQLKLRFNAEL